MQGNLVIISSPSGGGKGTLIREVLRTVPDIGYSVSLTTREPRPGEVEGVDYHFVTAEEFRAFAEAGRFLEFAEVHGKMYGTSLEVTQRIISEGRDVILEIDVQGAGLVLEKMPDAVSIFIMPPSFEVLRDRLTRRNTEGPAELALRLQNSLTEINDFEKFKYVVINDEVEAASRRLANVILGERQRRDRQMRAIEVILDSFDVSKL
jgi:guanylate kinase